ncbi:hypothetical protein ACFWWC_03685 [Streptomyces sp. NPDC058642]|uniref:hypothetical protein n=1 Tax=Streptomyces sp. NPDC058642 TaxID=3346572 RepID=UPI003659EA8C
MSTTEKPPHRNQEPEPVRPWFARLFRRPTIAERSRAVLIAADPVEAFVSGMRQAEELNAAREEAARWKAYADEYDREWDHAQYENAQLLAWLAALHPASAVLAPSHTPEGSQDLYIVAGGWQLSWPVAAAHADLFKHVTVVDVTDPRAQWDGHGTEQRGERIRGHVRLLALESIADAVVTPVMTPQEPEVVAYRDPLRPGTLLCHQHGKNWWGLEPLTAEDLPDGGLCTHEMPIKDEQCGRDVLTPPELLSA